MSDFETLLEAVCGQAEARPDAVHLYLRDEDGRFEPITFGELFEQARRVAGGLRARGVGLRDTIALMLPTGHDFFYSFLGVLLAGAVPVPIYPPVSASHLSEYAARQAGILRNAEVRGLITFRQAERLARLLRPQIPSLRFVVRAEQLQAGGRGVSASAPEPRPDELALLQYTSGSTGLPKGVMLTHANLLSNIRAIGHGVGVREDDVVVCWLPLYHDMGLIGCWLFSLVHGLPMVSLSPLHFLRRPERWLWALHAYRGTLSPAPNFAYELCVRKVAPDDIEGLDLSPWRVALNGAEPIHPATLERFTQKFSPFGFRPESMMPVYGLAENSVALTFHGRNTPPRLDLVERDEFQRRSRAVPLAPDAGDGSGAPDALCFVSVGRPVLGHEVRIVDDAGQVVEERVEGHVEFRGPSSTAGYYRNSEATAEIQTPDDWLRTGDLGYRAGGDLFLTGRSKDLIIRAGRNIYPHEVEAVAGEVEGIRTGCVAAFSLADPGTGTEELVVVAETRHTGESPRKRMASEIRKRVSAVVNVSPDRIHFIPPRTIPKTPSGKIRRGECRRMLVSGELYNVRPPAWWQVVRLAGGSAWAWLRQRLGRRST